VTGGYALALRAELPAVMAAALGAPGTAFAPAPATVELLRLCGEFSLQAAEKLLLAEGSKMVLASVESSYNQGVYGMVSNLGSLVVRLLFQPFEEGAFTAFVVGAQDVTAAKDRDNDNKEGEGGSEAAAAAKPLAGILQGMLKAAALAGGVIAAFGPAYSYTALRLVYGRRWSDTETAPALGLYSLYVALLAVNGISEAFTHAAADKRQLREANLVLVAFGAAHIALSFFLCQVHGTFGLIAADAVGMALRISYSMWFMRRYFRAYTWFSLWSWTPHRLVAVGLPAAAAAALASERHLLDGHRDAGFAPRACLHVGLGAGMLLALAVAMYKKEWSHLLDAVRLQQRKAD